MKCSCLESLFILGLCISFCSSKVDCCEKKNYISRQAIGRIATFGTIYDEINEEFQPLNLLKETFASKNKNVIKTIQGMGENIKVLNSNSDSLSGIFKQCQIDYSTGVNILSASDLVNGGVGAGGNFLHFINDNNRNRNLKKVSGVLLYTFHSVDQNLEIYSKGVEPFLRKDLLNQRGTHVVTGISWGVSVAVQLSKTASDEKSIQKLKDELETELEMLQTGFNSSKIPLQTESNFEVEIISDIPLSPPKSITTHGDILEIFRNVSKIIQNDNENDNTRKSKLIPLSYRLEPLESILDHFIQSITSDIFQVFDEIFNLEIEITNLEKLVLEPANSCLNEEILNGVNTLQNQFLESKTNFKMEVKNALLCVKIGTCNISRYSVLSLSSFQRFKDKIQKLEDSLRKMENCKIKLLNTNTQPFETESNLTRTIASSGSESSNRDISEAVPVTVTGCESNKTIEQMLNTAKDVRNLECGGLVNLPMNGSLFLKYKSSGILGEEQRCLWTLHSSVNENHYLNKIRISILCDRLDNSNDTLTLHEWMPWYAGDVTFLDLRSDSRDLLSTEKWKDQHFLYFSSKSVSPRAEFIVQIDIVGVTRWGTELNWFFDIVPGSVDYNQFKQLRSTSVAIAPSKTRSLQLTVEYVKSKIYSGSCSIHDTLDLYELGEGGIPRKLAKLCGRITDPISYSTEYPVIAVFYASSSSDVGTFKVSWK